MKGPNKAIKRQFHEMPRIEEMRTKMINAKYFTKLDLKSAFHHLRLSERARRLTTFMTPNGPYRFRRLMFGVNVAPEIFQRQMERILTGIMNIIVYMDDILIWGEDKTRLKDTTETVLGALRANNLSLNDEKCEYERESVNFLGHKFSATGINIEETKIRDIENFREPQSPSETRSFVGIAQFMSPFIEDFGTLAAPLYEVMGNESKKNRADKEIFHWGEAQSEAFRALKKAIINCTTTLGFFDKRDRTILYTDASPTAAGAVLVQISRETGEQRVISFASKSFSVTERKYAQTQREALAIVWGTERFYYYLLGAHFTIRTDAKGVKFIFERHSHGSKRVMSRAEGWAMRLDAFDFEMEFVKGSENIADPSSRLYQGEDPHYEEATAPNEIGTISGVMPIQAEFGENHLTVQEAAVYTSEDIELKEVLRALETDEWSQVSTAYRSVKDELREESGVVTRLGLVVIPKLLRNKALHLAHKGHPGMSKMSSAMKERIWWPGMKKAVEKWVEECEPCTLNGRKEPPTPMKRTQMPEAPWDYIAIDHCGPYHLLGGIHILSVMDYFSRYLIAIPVRSTKSNDTMSALEDQFDIFGYPDALKSDNGTSFTALCFEEYAAQRGITLVKSTPLAPWQNGMAEHSMQVIAKAITCALTSKKDFRGVLKDAVMAYNAAVHPTTKQVPNDVMFGRRVRRALPLMRPAAVHIDVEAMREMDAEMKRIGKLHEDKKRKARALRFKIGDTAVLRRAQKGKGESKYDPKEFKIIAIHDGDLTLKASDGAILKRSVTLAKRLREGTEQVGTEEENPRPDTRTQQATTDETEMGGQLAPQPPAQTPTTTIATRPIRNRRPPVRFSD